MAHSLPPAALPSFDETIARLRRYSPRSLGGQWRRAAVLVCLLDKQPASLLLTQRHARLNSHAGQVAFPGGKQDAGESLEQCALREAFEEVALRPESVSIIGRLSEVISLHGMAVTPFVATTTEVDTLKPNPGEVAQIFDIPLHYLASDPREATDAMRFRDQRTLFVPRYRYQDHVLWGLSAMITAELMRVGLGLDISLQSPSPTAPTRDFAVARASRYPHDYWQCGSR